MAQYERDVEDLRSSEAVIDSGFEDQYAPEAPPVAGWIRPQEVFPLFSGDPSLEGYDPAADESRAVNGLLFFDYDAYMGVPDHGWENNGLRTGGNFANRLGRLTDRWGICSQFGASMGVYGWTGADYRLQNNDRAQTQGFVTYGFYRRPTEDSRVVAGLVQDWSFNDAFGVFGENPVLSQLRWQIGYATSASNEYGVAGTAHLVSSVQQVPIFGETTWQSMNYLTAYWHHKWSAHGADTWITAGAPLEERLTGQGSVGDYLVSAIAVCPLSDVVAISSGVTYMHPSSRPGPTGAVDEMWNFSIGISIFPGRNARSATVAGQETMPLLPVANNGSFLVDTNKTY